MIFVTGAPVPTGHINVNKFGSGGSELPAHTNSTPLSLSYSGNKHPDAVRHRVVVDVVVDVVEVLVSNGHISTGSVPADASTNISLLSTIFQSVSLSNSKKQLHICTVVVVERVTDVVEPVVPLVVLVVEVLLVVVDRVVFVGVKVTVVIVVVVVLVVVKVRIVVVVLWLVVLDDVVVFIGGGMVLVLVLVV